MFNDRPNETREAMYDRWDQEDKILQRLVNSKIVWRRGYYQCADYVGTVISEKDIDIHLYLTKYRDREDVTNSYALTIESTKPVHCSYTICLSIEPVQFLYKEAEKFCRNTRRLERDGKAEARGYFLQLLA